MGKGFTKDIIKQIQTKFGKENEDIIYNPDKPIDSVSSGSVVADMIVRDKGDGGLLIKGRMTEIFGPESSGKTTFALQSIVQAQEKGWVGAFLDYEQTFDYDYARALGVKIDDSLIVIQPDDAEQGEKVLNYLVGVGKDNKFLKNPPVELDYLIIDSIAACAPRKLIAIENSTGEGGTKALHAAYWSNFIRKLNSIAKKRKIAIYLTNQVRNKFSMGGQFQAQAMKDTGIGAGFSQDAGWTTTGGQAVRFYMSVRNLVYQAKKLKEVREVNGVEKDVDEAMWVEFKNVKNKISAPFRKGRVVIRYGQGTDDLPPILDYLKANKVIVTSGAKYVYNSLDGNLDIEAIGEKKFKKLITDEVFEDMKEQYKQLKAMENPFENIDEDMKAFITDEDEEELDDSIEFEEVDTNEENTDFGEEDIPLKDMNIKQLEALVEELKEEDGIEIKIKGKKTKAKLVKELSKYYE